jgi:hypothetical protein
VTPGDRYVADAVICELNTSDILSDYNVAGVEFADRGNAVQAYA